MASVVLAGVSRVYPGGVAAVDHLDLEIRDQEFLVLVGPSGCGKTTTLRLIAGLERASAGTIRIGDRVVNDLAPRRRNIAMVFQGYALYPHLTVHGNLAFGLELRCAADWFGRLRQRVWPVAKDRVGKRRGAEAVERGQVDERVRQAAAALGIEPLLDRRPAELSGGQRQRVALGRAIVHEPAAFLFDEPLSNLDAQLRVEMRRELKQLHRRLATTMIYVTHDQVEALALADRIAVMEQGRVRQVGPPQEVYDQPS
ncbi:MAG TPA: ATP-binding cassette domain-containing protein, partial [Pirellulales bacterium]|nr:ATP-binding cassette domain-containing protein [Pirellulales bacterium]